VKASGPDAGVPAATAPGASLSRDDLAAECRVLTRHLVGDEPDDYIIDRYAAAHRARPELAASVPSDRPLLALARTGPLGARLADAHGRLFAPASALRRKLILLLAILETSPRYARHIDDPGAGPRWLVPLRLAAAGLGSLAALVLGTAILAPWRLLARAAPRPVPDREA
jgi:hypothetical protein